jgi:hypothetical protein
MNPKKSASSKFPLRLMPSVRKGADAFSRREGVSLNQFINVAVAEKLAHLQHDEWLARRPRPTAAMIARALEILDRPSGNAPASGDELPNGYISVRDTPEYRRFIHGEQSPDRG